MDIKTDRTLTLGLAKPTLPSHLEDRDVADMATTARALEWEVVVDVVDMAVAVDKAAAAAAEKAVAEEAVAAVATAEGERRACDSSSTLTYADDGFWYTSEHDELASLIHCVSAPQDSCAVVRLIMYFALNEAFRLHLVDRMSTLRSC